MRGLCLQTKALPERRMPGVPVRGASSPGGPLGAEESGMPCGPLPSSSLGSGPSTRRGGEDGTDLRRGANVPTAARGRECPAQQGGAGGAAWPSRPAAPAIQGLGARGQGKATSGGSLGGEGGGEGDEPKAGLAEGLTGSSTTLA